MAKIRVIKGSKTLSLDFILQGIRCREQTALTDTPENRKRLEKLLAKILAEIDAGTFEYGRYFPNSKRLCH